MLDAPIPTNEQSRLQELRSYALLDTPDEVEFDDISHLVREIAGTSIGIISLVDENRQWFKSCIGLDARETPRNISFCGHTILQRTPLIIGDALLDERFRDNPLVVNEPHIRFYAGFPLISRNGLALGSLCAVDHQPRQLKAEQITALARLARLVIKQMELSRHQHRHSETETSRQRFVKEHDHPTDQLNALHTDQQQLISMVDLMIRQGSEGSFSLMRLEFRDLRRIGNALGEAVATMLYQELLQRLSRLLPADASCAEVSDQEWLILLPFLSSESNLVKLTTTMIEQLQQPVSIKGQLLSSPVAIGMAIYEGNYSNANNLLADTAIALRSALREPGSRSCLIDLATRIEEQTAMRLETELREGLGNNNLQPYFQPFVDLATGAIVGMEALARWRSPNGDLLSPAVFLPAAERADLLADLDLVMMKRSIEASHTLAPLCSNQPMVLSLNLSSSLLASKSHFEQLLELLRSHALPHSWRLQLELLEGNLQHDESELARRLQCLHDNGVLLAIDDFGTGYSSLSRLNRYPFHTLKVDMSFIRLLNDPVQPSNRILTVIQAMAVALGLSTTAEGVETQEQQQWLREHGFQFAQGYLFSRPIAVTAMQEHLKRYGCNRDINAA